MDSRSGLEKVSLHKASWNHALSSTATPHPKTITTKQNNNNKQTKKRKPSVFKVTHPHWAWCHTEGASRFTEGDELYTNLSEAGMPGGRPVNQSVHRGWSAPESKDDRSAHWRNALGMLVTWTCFLTVPQPRCYNNNNNNNGNL